MNNLKNQTMKSINLDEAITRDIGIKGTPERDEFENKVLQEFKKYDKIISKKPILFKPVMSYLKIRLMIKNLISWIVFLPNIPIMIIAAIVLMVKIIYHTGIKELLLVGDGLFTKEFNEFLAKVYPKQLEVIVAILFYLTMFVLIIQQ